MSDYSTNFFQKKPCLSAHVLALRTDPETYINKLQFLCNSGTFAIVSSSVRACIIAALHISSKHEAVVMLLGYCEVTDICKALILLDRPRLVRQLSQKIQRIENNDPLMTVSSKEDAEKNTEVNTHKEDRRTKRRAKRSVDECRRKKQAVEDDFLEDDHSGEVCSGAHEDTAVQELIQSASVSGALARKVRRWAKTRLPKDFLEFVMLALPTGPWKTLADLVHFKPSDFSVPYFFRRMGVAFADDIIPVAEARLERLKSSWPQDVMGSCSKVAVFGDASSSMQTAINAATIFAGMVSVFFDGELSFFKSELVQSPHKKPRNARETLDVCNKIRAEKSTAHAACMWPYYKEKKAMDLFVIVTDEVENRFYNGHRFGSLFEKYLDEVNPFAKLVVVCVGEGDGTFRQSLSGRGIRYTTVYIDDSRPDLAKFDALLGRLAMACSQSEASTRTVDRKAPPTTAPSDIVRRGPTETEHESSPEKIKSQEESSELDLVFVVDNTGSMGSWIHSAQRNIQSIIRDIIASEGSDVRFALVSYRDHPPQDHSFVTKIHDFTGNVREVQHWVDGMRASGGGDCPEAVADGLHACLNLSYRPNSTKVAVMIADAPPHGIGCSGDGFPNGCPKGHDPLEIVRAMAAKGITIYSVICGNFEGQAFYQGIAQMTGGQYIPISSAHLLAGVIVGGAQEEITLEKLMQDAQNTIEAEEKAAGRELDDDELAARLQSVFRAKRMTARRTQFGGIDLPDFEAAAEHYSSAIKIADVRNSSSSSHLSLGSFGGGLDTAPGAAESSFAAEEFAEVSYAQCKRMAKKSKARKGS